MATAKKKIRRRTVGIILLVIGVIAIIFFGFLTFIFASQGWGVGGGGIFLTIVGVIVSINGIVLIVLPTKKRGKPALLKQAEAIT